MRARQDSTHLGISRHAHTFVQVALLACQGHTFDDLGHGQQLRGHVFLAPPQDEGPHALREQLGAHCFAVHFNRFAPQPLKTARVAQKPRHQKVKLRPQLPQVVFQWRTRQAQAMTRL